jgi:hypothetical protein
MSVASLDKQRGYRVNVVAVDPSAREWFSQIPREFPTEMRGGNL